jgi:hypothetical protein
VSQKPSKRTCSKNQLFCWVPVSYRYKVDKDGNATTLIDTQPEDTSEGYGYSCSGCNMFWQVTDKWSKQDCKDTWQKALEHITVSNQTINQKNGAN